ncbi:glutamate--tRNA ligase [Gemmatimonadota bacterium]
MDLRVRFAPSPTGYLHVGGARTALFNWLLARESGGVFVLRIEDTDRDRSREEHTQAILHGLEWLGLGWDEGPFFQSHGLPRHKADALTLLDRGSAYRDFSTPEEATKDREEDVAAGRRLRRARLRAENRPPEEEAARLDAGHTFAIRFRVPDGETVWADGVHGEMRFQNDEIDDLVILRSDGSPTYNLAVVSDDVEMGITMVLRGDDHLSNTPKQILLYEALGRPVPLFSHVPLILGPDGKRLSKRHGATAVGDYEKEGILPEAMFNFLALLGWSPGDEREVMTRMELVGAFSLTRVLKKASVFDLEKLQWLNGQHLARRPTSALLEPVSRRLAQEGWVIEERTGGSDGSAPVDLEVLIDLLKVRSRTVEDLVRQAEPFFTETLTYDPAAVKKHWAKDPERTSELLEKLRGRLAGVPWTEEGLESSLRGLADELEVGAGKLIHPLRVALTGLMASPGIFEVLQLLGKDRSLSRLDEAISLLRSVDLPSGSGKKTLS